MGHSGGDLQEYRKAKCQRKEAALTSPPAAENQQEQGHGFSELWRVWESGETKPKHTRRATKPFIHIT